MAEFLGFTLPYAGISLDDLEKELFMHALKRTDYNKVVAAKLLNISYDSFSNCLFETFTNSIPALKEFPLIKEIHLTIPAF